MARAYRECSACGQRALRIATRCPRCGHEFPTQPVRWQGPRNTTRFRPLPAAAVILLAIGVLTLVMRPTLGRHPEAKATAAGRVATPLGLGSAASPAVPDSAPSSEAVPRVARTWTKVHARRSTKADLVAVLLPGDTVLADSLRGGWWRVALEGRVLGYVSARTLIGD